MSSSEMLLDAKRGTIQNPETLDAAERPSAPRRAVEIAQAPGKTIVRRQDETEADSDGVEDVPDMPANRAAPRASQTVVSNGMRPGDVAATYDMPTGFSSNGISSGGSSIGLGGKHSALADELRGQTSGPAVDAGEDLVEVAEARVKPKTIDTIDRKAPRFAQLAGPVAWLAVGAAAAGVAIAGYLVLTQSDAVVLDDAQASAVADSPEAEAGLAALKQARELERQGKASEAWSLLQTYKMTTPMESWPKDLLKELNRLESRLAQ